MKGSRFLAFFLFLVLLSSILLPLIRYKVWDDNGSSFALEENRESGVVCPKTDVTDNVASDRTFGSGKSRWKSVQASEWESFAKASDSLAELVIGEVPDGQGSLADLEDLVINIEGKIIKRISNGANVEAIVVGIPFESVSVFVDMVESTREGFYVEPNRKFEADFTPNDPYWSYQWGPQKIQSDYAWNTTVGDKSILVAIVDTGIDYNHPDLAANYVPLGYDWVNNDNDPLDDHGHGSHVSGIVAATSNNSVGIAGVAQVRIMVEKALDQNGQGYEDDLANAITHAVDQGARVLSCSWGGDSSSALIEAAMEYAYSHGVLVVASAGNSASQLEHFPAAYDEVVAVTATGIDDKLASFSNFGDWVDVSAPGVSIVSTVPMLIGYDSRSGTSMSAPHAAGVAALILSHFPNFSNIQLQQALFYSTDDLGNPGFDIYYGYGRVNARKAVEELPLEHDLVLWNWTRPPYVEPNDLGLINATIYNFGLNIESNITVQLLANGTVVDSQGITSLAVDSFSPVTLAWNPEVEGTYNLTVYVLPVSGETNTWFNTHFDHVYVGFPLRIAVLDSRGTDLPQAIEGIWEKLNNEWKQFGNQMIHVDYTSLDRNVITYDDIEAIRADVLFISFADLREYSDEEIEAISKYAYEGHGLIATALSLGGVNTPNNAELAPLFGLRRIAKWNWTSMDVLNVLDQTHPLFINVPSSLNFSRLATFAPEDSRWNLTELQGGTYVALGDASHSAIVAYRGFVYISPDLEGTGEWPPPPIEASQLQLLYNAMTWSRFQRPQHELVASLKVPGFVLPMETASINATVSNIGISDETNVTLQVLVNGSIVYSNGIPNLLGNSSYTFVCSWQPTTIGTYEITASVKTAAGEDNEWNNEASQSISVLVPPDILVVADNDEYEDPQSNSRTSLKEFTSALDQCGSEYYVWEEKVKGSPSFDLLRQFKLVIWSCGEAGDFVQITTADASNLVSYVRQGGRIILDGDWIALSHYDYINFNKYVTHANYAGMTWPWLGGTEGLKVIKSNHLVAWGLPAEFQWSNKPLIATGIGPNYGGFTVVNYIDNPDPDTPPGHQTLPQVISWGAITLSETPENGGSTMFYSFPFFGIPEEERVQIMKNTLSWMFPRDHELYVTVNSFRNNFHGVNSPAWINVTVTNWGRNNETNVELQVLVSGKLVDVTVLPEIRAFLSLTHSYRWNVESVGSYSITAQVLPVLGEDVLYNNLVDQHVEIRRLVVAMISEKKELESLIPILDSVGIGYHIYNENKYYGYSKIPSFLSAYRVIMMYKGGRQTTSTENLALQSYLNAGGNILVTGVGALIFQGVKDAYMSNIVRTKVWGTLFQEAPMLYVVNDSHPIMYGPYGKFNTGYVSPAASYLIENTTADTARGAITVARAMPEGYSFADKIVATDLKPGRVVYWNGNGIRDWTQKEDSQSILKNIISWMEFGEIHDLEVSVKIPDMVEPGKPMFTEFTVRNVGHYDEHDIELRVVINGTDTSSIAIATLAKKTSYTLDHQWTPLNDGTYNFTAYVPAKAEEFNKTNNIHSACVQVAFWPHIFLIAPKDVAVDQVFSVNATISNATRLNRWEIELYYRNYILNATSVGEGTFMSSAGSTVFQVQYFNNSYNATHGYIRLACSLENASQGANGNGILAIVTFKAKATGLCRLGLLRTILVTLIEPSPYPHYHEDELITVGLLGDINNDGIIDIYDLLIVATAFGSAIGEPNWKPQADILPDNNVDIFDIITLAVNYG